MNTDRIAEWSITINGTNGFTQTEKTDGTLASVMADTNTPPRGQFLNAALCEAGLTESAGIVALHQYIALAENWQQRLSANSPLHISLTESHGAPLPVSYTISAEPITGDFYADARWYSV